MRLNDRRGIPQYQCKVVTAPPRSPLLGQGTLLNQIMSLLVHNLARAVAAGLAAVAACHKSVWLYVGMLEQRGYQADVRQ